MTDVPLDQRFAEAMGHYLGPDFPTDIGLAVSGGGDSMAMLYLAHNWTRSFGVRLWVVTVDHGLRPESADEARMVAEECAALGWPHATLRWNWDGQGNVQDAARRARLNLLNRWRGVLRHILVAHTRDDVAETFLMRLERGSGVAGLSAMAAQRSVTLGNTRLLQEREFDGELPPQEQDGGVRADTFTITRPCLDMTRAELRHYAKTLKGRWVDDPSNEDDTYLRVKMRKLLPTLEKQGLSVDRLAQTAQRLAMAKEALTARALQVWSEIGIEGKMRWVPTGELLFDRTGFEKIERDTQLRLLSAALRYVASAEYTPRFDALNALLDRVLGGGAGTLHGCVVQMEKDQIRVFREYDAVKDVRLDFARQENRYRLWDNRWRVNPHGIEGAYIRAVGQDGWEQIEEKPIDAPPHVSARSLPSIWAGNTLISCDPLGVGNGLRTKLWPMGRELGRFAAFLRNS